MCPLVQQTWWWCADAGHDWHAGGHGHGDEREWHANHSRVCKSHNAGEEEFSQRSEAWRIWKSFNFWTAQLLQICSKFPAKLNQLNETIRIVGSHKFVITSDLTDSFWQRHVKTDKLPYFGTIHLSRELTSSSDLVRVSWTNWKVWKKWFLWSSKNMWFKSTAQFMPITFTWLAIQ